MVMFTGLIQDKGKLLRTERRGPDAAMVIQARFPMDTLTLGESIAVDGACLTVVSFQGNVFTVDVSAETLSRTTLGQKQPGSLLNLERALRMGERLGGHLVTGHIDGLGTLRERRQEGRSWRLVFAVPPDLDRYIIEKGSVAVDGVSLTVNACSAGSFAVNIVPHTLAETTLADLKAGDTVNIETDLIGKYVEKMLHGFFKEDRVPGTSGRIDATFLQKHGFL
jgi:riboflavin synthase